MADLLELGLYTINSVLDASRDMYKADSAVEYTYTLTGIQICSEKGDSEMMPDLIKEAQWKAASNKEVENLNRNNVYIFMSATSVPVGHKYSEAGGFKKYEGR